MDWFLLLWTAATFFLAGRAWGMLSDKGVSKRLTLCETSLSIWDDTRSSEYWIRYGKKGLK